MKVSVLGTGYVGLVSGVCLAEKGHQVVCVDIDPQKVAQTNQGIPVIFENGLEALLKKEYRFPLQRHDGPAARGAGNRPLHHCRWNAFQWRSDRSDLHSGGLPADRRDPAGKARLPCGGGKKYRGSRNNRIGRSADHRKGLRKKRGLDFGIGMNPEFLREGMAVQDFMHPDRIVLGGVDERTLDQLEALYSVLKGWTSSGPRPKPPR
jgi:UDPglucose 6-dehydrogenase